MKRTWRHSALDASGCGRIAATWEVMREPMILLSVQAMLGQQASEA